jgi:hypothetical protein
MAAKTKKTVDITTVLKPEINITALGPEQVGQQAAQIEAMNLARKDYVVAPQHVTFLASEEPGDLRVAIQFQDGVPPVMFTSMTKTAHQQLAALVGIPKAYYDRMLVYTPELLAHNLTVWMNAPKEQSGREDDSFLIRIMGPTIRAWLSNRYKVIDNSPIFFHSYSAFQRVDAQLVRLDLTDDWLYLRALKADWGVRIEHQLEAARSAGEMFQGFNDQGGIHKVGSGGEATAPMGLATGNEGGGEMYKASRDPNFVIPAVVISNSETGGGRAKASLGIFRPYCRNLAVFVEQLAVVHLGAPKETYGLLSDATLKLEAELVYKQVEDIIVNAFDMDKFKQFIVELETASGMELEHPVEAVENVVKSYAFSDADKQRMINELVSGGDPTVFGLMQAITATGREKNSYNDGYRFERIGAEVLLDVVHNKAGSRKMVEIKG